jgi:hypothetical protein
MAVLVPGKHNTLDSIPRTTKGGVGMKIETERKIIFINFTSDKRFVLTVCNILTKLNS